MAGKILRLLSVILLLLVLGLVVLAMLARPASDHPFFSDGPPRPWVIAHQGGDGLWPSNTLYAMERAAAMGVDVLEMDIHSTADGVLVVMHDATVDRTTDGQGPINGFTLAELKLLDAGYDWPTLEGSDGDTHPYRGQGITVPALEEIFTAFPGWRMNIEIKQVDPPIAEPFCRLIRQHGLEDQVLVGSFHQEAMDAFRNACPEVATSGTESEIRPFFILNTIFLGLLYTPPANAFQVPEYSGSLHVLTRGFVNGAHGRGVEVHAWTINEVDDMERLLDLGVDGIITDYPDRLLTLLQRGD
jgi:glycerophosphoryl diester phosphodiesterase